MQAERDLGLHVGEFFLHQLIGGERPAELLAAERIFAGAMPAEFRGPHGAPGDARARDIEAAERTGEAGNVRQQIFFRDHGAVEHDLAGDRGAQAELAFDLRRGKSLGVALDDEAADFSFELRPDNRHMSATGALVIQVLLPVRRKPPGTFSARVVIEPGSEPWSGSVSPKQPRSSPLAILGRYLRRCASLP